VRLYRKALLSTEQQQSKALASTSNHGSVLSKEEQVITAITYLPLISQYHMLASVLLSDVLLSVLVSA
jgi:hypothetical protein